MKVGLDPEAAEGPQLFQKHLIAIERGREGAQRGRSSGQEALKEGEGVLEKGDHCSWAAYLGSLRTLFIQSGGCLSPALS